MKCRKARKEKLSLRENKKEADECLKMKKAAQQRAEMIKAKKNAVAMIERYWGKFLWKRELKKAREFLKKLPHDCRILWVKLNCVKAQATDLKEEIDQLVNGRTAAT